MKLGCVLACTHAVVMACLGWITLPMPFHGFRWLRVVDFIVVWDAQDVGLVVVKALGAVGHASTLAQVSTYAMSGYFASFVVAGSFQWFVIGLAITRLRARFGS